MKLKFFAAGLIALTGAQSNNLCQEGYEVEMISTGYICNDIDECAQGTHTCSDNAKCTNTLGSYTCECKSGKRSKCGHQIMF